MLKQSMILAVALCALGTGTTGAATPDLAPSACAWEKLPAEEQSRLRAGFKVEVGDGGFTLAFADSNSGAAADAARLCNLNLTPEQTQHFGAALSRHAATLQAAKGVADRGESPSAIQASLAKMHEGKRERIGDTLSCPGPHSMVKEWDSSVMSAVKKANLRFKNGAAYSWVSLGVYAAMAEEGAMRRTAGQAEACS